MEFYWLEHFLKYKTLWFLFSSSYSEIRIYVLRRAKTHSVKFWILCSSFSFLLQNNFQAIYIWDYFIYSIDSYIHCLLFHFPHTSRNPKCNFSTTAQRWNGNTASGRICFKNKSQSQWCFKLSSNMGLGPQESINWLQW